ncbi:metallophosphoesterase family protein [Roseibium aestuarii]|uniref:Metallophosphoesterase family protein n=1 Tax=Roseibium aestuarii TaxID=2600299 RepID=A0ABW4JWE2_9HYPH|nr:metallophosphoesterase [Roseibium aestuarii]
MRLHAISDLHLSAEENRAALLRLPDHGADWLIVAGDLAERFDHMRFGFEELAKRFDRVIWVPGNHELWSIRRKEEPDPLRGVARYDALVELAREFQVVTPEDSFPLWPGATHGNDGAAPLLIAPLFLLYDFSFRPEYLARRDVSRWAREHRTACGDDFYLKADPHPDRESWCAHRLEMTRERLARRLEGLPETTRTVLVNHYPLRQDLIRLPRAPRLAPWCGTRETRDWHRIFRADVVVSGHLHTRRTDHRHGTRFEEVSLGYPAQWDQERGMAAYLRLIR